jgi:hypothetical protein
MGTEYIVYAERSRTYLDLGKLNGISVGNTISWSDLVAKWPGPITGPSGDDHRGQANIYALVNLVAFLCTFHGDTIRFFSDQRWIDYMLNILGEDWKKKVKEFDTG